MACWAGHQGSELSPHNSALLYSWLASQPKPRIVDAVESKIKVMHFVLIAGIRVLLTSPIAFLEAPQAPISLTVSARPPTRIVVP